MGRPDSRSGHLSLGLPGLKSVRRRISIFVRIYSLSKTVGILEGHNKTNKKNKKNAKPNLLNSTQLPIHCKHITSHILMIFFAINGSLTIQRIK